MILDSQLKPTTAKVGSGSKARVSCEVNPYCTPAGDTGVTLWVKAVQILELAEYRGSDYGFKPMEGFETNDVDLVPTEVSDF